MDQKPRISVHALSEFVFCPRAGLLAFESAPEDPGHDLGAQRLDFAPNYLVGALQKEFVQLLAIAVALTVTAVVATVFCWRSDFSFGRFAGLGIVYAFFKLTPPIFVDLIRVSAALFRATVSSAREPDLSNPEDERIGWWQLVSAGYDVTVSNKLHDAEANIGGNPWRLMIMGRTVVPVFLRRSADTEQLRTKHRVRMNAYCRLLTLAGNESPFGVILDYGTEKCWIVKPTSASWQQALSHLESFRRAIAQATIKSQPVEPNNPSICRGCPWGEPTTVPPTEPLATCSGIQLSPHWIASGSTRFHSICGDRFRWTPIHERTLSGNYVGHA